MQAYSDMESLRASLLEAKQSHHRPGREERDCFVIPINNIGIPRNDSWTTLGVL